MTHSGLGRTPQRRSPGFSGSPQPLTGQPTTTTTITTTTSDEVDECDCPLCVVRSFSSPHWRVLFNLTPWLKRLLTLTYFSLLFLADALFGRHAGPLSPGSFHDVPTRQGEVRIGDRTQDQRCRVLNEFFCANKTIFFIAPPTFLPVSTEYMGKRRDFLASK